MVQARTKHIHSRPHFSRQAVKSGQVKLIDCATELMLADALTRAAVLKIKQVLLDSCSSKRMQTEHKHEALDQSSQARTDPEASKQYSDSFPLISFELQQYWISGLQKPWFGSALEALNSPRRLVLYSPYENQDS